MLMLHCVPEGRRYIYHQQYTDGVYICGAYMILVVLLTKVLYIRRGVIWHVCA